MTFLATSISNLAGVHEIPKIGMLMPVILFAISLKVIMIQRLKCSISSTQRSSIFESKELIDCLARYKCPFENMLLKLSTKAEH